MINLRNSKKLRSFSSLSTSILSHKVNVFNNVHLSIPENVDPASFEPLFR